MKVDQNIWFSPAKILHYYALRESQNFQNLSKDDIKQIKEARMVAIALLGIIKFYNKDFWMQLVDSQIDQTPDIRTSCNNNIDNSLEIQEVELVTYESHTNEDLAEFILSRKLSGKKKYPKETTILCYIDKTTRTEPWIEIHKKLEHANLPNDTFLIGRVSPDEHVYQIAQVHPVVNVLETVDIKKMAYDHKMINTLKMKKSKIEEKTRLIKTSERFLPF